MFFDARELPSGDVVTVDVAIVGAGAAGITMAMQLTGSGLTVALLESGGLDFEWVNQSLYTAANVGLPYYALDMCQLRYLGGSTNAWGGWCRPLDAIDFEYRPWVSHSGWPFSQAELKGYYKLAHKILEVPSDDYDVDRTMAELNHRRAKPLPFDQKWLETSVYRFSTPTRFGLVYREALERMTDVRVYHHANVLSIKTDSAARTVTRLTVGTLSGTRFDVVAKHYVLAAGGIENVRMLLVSSDVVSAGLGNQHDQVGRYFMEHPHTKRNLIVPSKRIESAIYGEMFHSRATMSRIAVPEARQRKEEMLNYSANLHAVYHGQNSDGWFALRKVVLSLSRSRRTDPFIRFPPFGRKGLTMGQFFDMVRQFPQMTVAGFLRLIQPDGFISGFVLESKPEQAPNPDSRVTLDHGRDALGVQRVKLDWRTLTIDRRTAIRGEEIIDAEMQRLGIGKLEDLAPNEVEGWPENLEGGWHQLGTTRMHDDPKQGVVDANSRVHGMTNLFITGGSVFPTGGAAPPTLTVVAMALRLAHHLKHSVFQLSSARSAAHPVAAQQVAREISDA